MGELSAKHFVGVLLNWWQIMKKKILEPYLLVVFTVYLFSGKPREISREENIFAFFCGVSKAPFTWRKVVPGKRVTLLAESTLPSVYMRKKLTPLPEPRADNRAHACSDCLALTELTRLSEPKRLYGEKLARPGE